jgi:heme iron utilization protein
MRAMQEQTKAFNGPYAARELYLSAHYGTLATVTARGAPFASLVALAQDDHGCPVFITSHLSAHTAHLERDSRVALLVAKIGEGDPLTHARLTLMGTVTSIRPGTEGYNALRERYLRQNPAASLYVDLPGFWFWKIAPESASLNAGFGKAWNGLWQELNVSADHL